ncbi:MAG: GTPase ObgE [Polyangiaceae bacterium]|nr:GTPase ObgE [Polyangiaceae bacterium]
MRFIDECTLQVIAGNGGDGCIAFRRAKFVPFGGPSGGDGGRGGDVVLVGDPGRNTLLDLVHVRVVKAEPGGRGEGRDCHGRAASDREIRLPLGTIIYDAETGEQLAELTEAGQTFVVVRGGKGGRGNKHFTTPTDRAPRRAEPGTPGEQRLLRLELKVLADVGLLGFPNVGKSTLIRAVSRARPEVADYPFTTLRPHLGVVTLDERHMSAEGTFVIADIPGLIEGASEGAGLGTHFLKHLERTRVLLHLITLSGDPARSPITDYEIIRRELERFDPELAKQPELVAMTKSDLPDVEDAYPEVRDEMARRGIELHLISAATNSGLGPLMNLLAEHVGRARNKAP